MYFCIYLNIFKTMNSYQYFKFQPNVTCFTLVFSFSIFEILFFYSEKTDSVILNIFTCWSVSCCSQTLITAATTPPPFQSHTDALFHLIPSCGWSFNPCMSTILIQLSSVSDTSMSPPFPNTPTLSYLGSKIPCLTTATVAPYSLNSPPHPFTLLKFWQSALRLPSVGLVSSPCLGSGNWLRANSYIGHLLDPTWALIFCDGHYHHFLSPYKYISTINAPYPHVRALIYCTRLPFLVDLNLCLVLTLLLGCSPLNLDTLLILLRHWHPILGPSYLNIPLT